MISSQNGDIASLTENSVRYPNYRGGQETKTSKFTVEYNCWGFISFTITGGCSITVNGIIVNYSNPLYFGTSKCQVNVKIPLRAGDVLDFYCENESDRVNFNATLFPVW